MIIYQNTKGGFIDDIRNGYIADKIQEELKKHNLKQQRIISLYV